MGAILDAAVVAIFGGLLCFCAVTLHEVLGVLKKIRNDGRRTGEQEGNG